MEAASFLLIKTSLNVQRTPEEVFEAIVDPVKMSGYFIASSTGRMEAGKTLLWKFPEFDMEFPVKIISVQPARFVSFSWEDPEGIMTTVEITLKPEAEKNTSVTITEGPRDHNAAGIKWLQGNTEGWANFLACLKAYMEYGINLRKGAFSPARVSQKESAQH